MEGAEGVVATVRVVDRSPGATGDEPVLVRMASVQHKPLEWLWPGRIPLGRVSFLVGDPGCGKSFIALDMAARVTRGSVWPDGADNVAGDVLLLVADDSLGGAVRPRLEAAEANLNRVMVLRAVKRGQDEATHRFSLKRDIPALELAIEATPGARLLVIDPLTAYLGRGGVPSDAEVHDILLPLEELAERTGVAVLAVSHFSKRDSGPLVQRASGSMAFMAAARSVWAVGADHNEPERRLLVPVKSNVSACGTGLACRVVESGENGSAPRLVWERGPVRISPSEAVAAAAGRPPTERQAAAAWLRALLADGPMVTTDLQEVALREGLAWPTVRRARLLAGVVCDNGPFQTPLVWRLPGGPAVRRAFPEHQPAQI